MRLTRLAPVLFLLLTAADWPQFRGPNATGIADVTPLPDKIGPNTNVLWQIELPPGHSSPAVVGERIYVTAVRDKALLTIALDRATGKVLWERESPYKTLEKIHNVGSYAQPSPAADGQLVVSFFGSSGLNCYDRDGKLLWRKPMGPFPNEYGAGSSPILVGDRVILNQDHDNSSFLAAYDKKSGEILWKKDRSEFPRGYATPVVWEVGGKKQIVVAGTLRVIGYDFDTGDEVWTVRGISRITNMTPTVGADNVLYLAAWAPGADAGERIVAEPFADMLAKYDKNKNGTLEFDEIPPGELKNRFPQLDRDKDGHVSKEEYENMRRIFATAENVVIAIKPGGTGEITDTHVLWTQKKVIPYVPSPLYHKGLIFLVKNGGLVSCLDARTGKPTRQERVFGSAGYYASPVAGDGKVYLFSEKGDGSVISATAEWEQLSRAKFGEPIYATPAIADGKIYVRTDKHLYCFGKK
ncbi:MAG: PQQ-binding-like beta-propeller repeat protein [Gemmataceae bacterium]